MIATKMEVVKAPQSTNDIQEFSTDLLRVYYGRLFPYDEMFNWLSYGNDPEKKNLSVDKDYFPHREWSFTIEDDIYIRYQSFQNKNEFMAAIQKRQPHKIDIGAVFSAPPKDHNTVKPELFKPVERELVFDIDMTDYDDIRTCCSGAAICPRCWPYMTMALKVVDQALRDDFAFRHILWIYSGRRGIHCWVSDEEARCLSNEARSAIVEYLSVSTGTGDNTDRKIKNAFLSPLHPMIKRAYETLEPFFESCICHEDGQGLLATRTKYVSVLNSMPNEQIRVELAAEWSKREGQKGSGSGAERWRQLKERTSAPAYDQPKMKKIKVNYAELESWRVELVFKHCYPRLDANVSKSQNHLLKSPFCIHPKTGRVCVPIDPSNAEKFDPFTVPTVRTLCAEVDDYDKIHPDAQDVTDREKTSLRGAIQIFEKTFWHGMCATIRTNMLDKADRIRAMTVDY